jgi:hypothetical protein
MARCLRTLSRIGDTLWPSGADAEPRVGRALPTYAGVAAAIALLLVLRRTDAITNPQFWAEDATVFFQENLKLGCWQALHTYFRGFPYLAQTLIACAATPVPIARVPLAYNLVAYTVAAASLAAFSLPSFRHVIRSDARRVVFCIAVAAIPQARELVGSITNTSWYLGIWLMLLTIMRLPRAPIGLAALAVGCWLATFSTPLSVVAAPLWLARAVHAGLGKRRSEAIFAALGLAAVLVLIGAAGDLGRDPGRSISPVRPLLNIVSLRVLADAALGSTTLLRLADRFTNGVVYAVAGSLLVALGTLAWTARWRSLPFLLYSAYGIVASCTLALVGHRFLAALANNLGLLIEKSVFFSGRYQVLPVSLIYLAFLATIDRLPRARARAIATGVMMLWLMATEAPSFVLPPFRDLQWPSRAAQLERKLTTGSSEPLTIPINPDRYGYRFNLAFDLRAIAPEVTVPADVSLGPLLDGTTIEQTFVARCSPLSQIDLWLDAEGDPITTVHVDISDDTTGAVVARLASESPAILSQRSETQKIVDRIKSANIKLNEEAVKVLGQLHLRRVLYFPPVRDSEGKRYVVRVRATDGALGNAITVYGSAGDAYRDGGARRNGEPIAGDVAFRYGCTLP